MVKKFWVRGKWSDTNRVRKELLIAWDKDEAIDIAKKKGMIDGFEVTEDWASPTERQLDYAKSLGIKVQDDMSVEDVSALISRKVDSDNQDPQPGLIEFAREHRLVFSDYIGKKALYSLVFRELGDMDRVAFFAFSIYRFISDDRAANLNQHTYNKLLYEFASKYVNDKKFMSSMNRYDGENIRFFGKLRVENSEYTGGSTRTQAFRDAKKFLLDNSLIAENMQYHTKKINTTVEKIQHVKPIIPKNIPEIKEKKKVKDRYIDPAKLSKDQTGKNIPRQIELKAPYKWYLNGWFMLLLVLLTLPTYGISLIPVFIILYYREKFRKEYFKKKPRFMFSDD